MTMPGLTAKVRLLTHHLLAVPLGQPLELDHADHARGGLLLQWQTETDERRREKT